MAKKTPPKHATDRSAFELALLRLSVAQLKALCVKYRKRVPASGERQSFITALDNTMSEPEKLDAMRTFILAGKGSMSMVKFVERTEFAAEVNFVDHATLVPKIVHIGEPGKIFDGLTHLVWAVAAGNNSFIDRHLELNVDPEAEVIDSFFDHRAQVLQVRSGTSQVKRIQQQWAEMHDVDEEKGLLRIGLRDRDDFHAFVHQIGATVTRTKGRKLEGKGFEKISGELKPGYPTLIGTEDYDEFNKTAHTTDSDLQYQLGDDMVKLSFGFEARSVVFRTLANEAAYQDVYAKLTHFEKARAKGKHK